MKQISKVVTIIVLVVSAMSVKAETHYLDVGETLTLYLPSNVSGLASNGCVSKCAIIVPEPSYSFYVWTVGGEKIGYPLATRPKVVYDGENIVLTTHSETVEYPAKDVWKYTLEEEMSMQQPESSIEPPVIISPTMRQTERTINISGCRPGSSVMLYSLGGVLLQTGLADSDGNLQLSISDYVQGVYIIKTETITYKIIKR